VLTNKTIDDLIFITLSPRVRFCKRRYVLEFCDECIWVEIPIFDCLNLIKDLGLFPVSEPYFHQHVDYLFYLELKFLGLVRTVTFSFYSFCWCFALA
jgi:hypothetical protein